MSFTTRPRRTGERQKKDYFFISEKEFKNKLRQKKILEWTRYLGYYYGTPKDFVEWQLNKSKAVVHCLDVKGALRIKRLYPRETVTIFVMPASVDTLPQRIQQRCSKTKTEEIKKRIQLAKTEIQRSHVYEHRLVNKELDKALKELKGILIKEMRFKRN